MIAYWLFMLAMTLLVPLTMVVCGKRFVNIPPKSINMFFGYRTTRSMRNRETWAFAHRCCGQYWWNAGRIVLLCTALVMCLFVGRDIETVSNVGLILVFVQIIPLILAFPVTESALKREFDQFGRRIVR